MRLTLSDLLREHGALSLEKQDALGDYLGEHSWSLDLTAGTIDFGAGRVFPIQLLGTESFQSETWLWAWANRESDIPEPLLAAAARLRELGAAQGITELITPELPSTSLDLHMVGAIGCGVTSADAYYLGHHQHGAVLLLLRSPVLRALLKPSVLHMTTIFMGFVSTWEVADQRRAFIAYARAKGCTIQELGNRVGVTDPRGEQLVADFDTAGRVVNLEGGPLVNE
jgi:hypothetical protein